MSIPRSKDVDVDTVGEKLKRRKSLKVLRFLVKGSSSSTKGKATLTKYNSSSSGIGDDSLSEINVRKVSDEGLDDKVVELENTNNELAHRCREQAEQLRELKSSMAQVLIELASIKTTQHDAAGREEAFMQKLSYGIVGSVVAYVISLGLVVIDQGTISWPSAPMVAALLYPALLVFARAFVRRTTEKRVQTKTAAACSVSLHKFSDAQNAPQDTIQSVPSSNRSSSTVLSNNQTSHARQTIRRTASNVSERSFATRSKSTVLPNPPVLIELEEEPGKSFRQTSRASISSTDGESLSNTTKSLVSPSAMARQGSRQRLNTLVDPEFGLTCNSWLNFFEGLDVKIEDISYYKDLSQEQKALFKDFRKEFLNTLGGYQAFDRMKPYTLPDDASILRFLMADKFDTKLAMKRLLSTVVWRQEIDLPKLISEPPACLDLYRSLRVRRFLGFDNEKRPVFAERIGEFIGALSSSEASKLKQNDFLMCYIYDMGQFIQQFREAAKQGNPCWKQTYIADCKGVKWMPALKSVNLLKSFAKEVEIHFPEQAGPIFLINCPSVVTRLWGVVKQFLDPVVISKINIYSGVPTDVLLQHMDADVLFEEYGGNNKAPYPHVK